MSAAEISLGQQRSNESKRETIFTTLENAKFASSFTKCFIQRTFYDTSCVKSLTRMVRELGNSLR